MEIYDKVFNLDVRALVNVTIECLPLLIKSKGNILNVSSILGTACLSILSLYSGAKAAINNFTKCWALELAKDGVRVNAIAPGAIETNIWNGSKVLLKNRKSLRNLLDQKLFLEDLELLKKLLICLCF